MNAQTNAIENNKCAECSAEYNGHHDDKWCENCRYQDCAMCGECVHRDDVCPHGVDGSNACECECPECLHQEEELKLYCVILILYSMCIR